MDARVWEILFVEDDEDDLLFMQEMLNEALGSDYAIKWIKNPAELERIDCSARPDVAILDYRFDAQSALELVEKVHRGCPGLPIIFLSQWPAPSETEAVIERTSFFLMKSSLDSRVLGQAIADAVSVD